MWSVDFADNGLLGYAQFPSGAGLPGITPNMEGPAITDGVVAGYSTLEVWIIMMVHSLCRRL
ncbi:hypothetical protein EJ377_18350 [Chryseobacterium arthrosphaerae]|uniref:Uncharacterized protein n=1 Tax=Chryseobacterium arthrosphaerae TaxID=651561 RepID=A0A432DTF3_9FLAO|nr:hypothetical protein EJ377_18350 [Chryseobacterium arthrosphaerae]